MIDDSKKNKSQLLGELQQLKVENAALKTTQNLFQNGPVVVFKWRNSENWPVEFVSTNVSDIFGYTANDFCNGSVSYGDIIDPSDIKQVATEVEKSSAEGIQAFDHLPYKILHKDGSVRWLHDHTVIVRNKSCEITHYYGYVFDVTQQQNIERAYNTSEIRSQSILDNTAAVVSVKDLEGRYLQVNQGYEKQFNIQFDEVAGKTDYEVFSAPRASEFVSHDIEVQELNQKIEFEECFTQSGEERVFLSQKFPLYDDRNEMYAVCAISLDITQRKKMQQALQESRDLALFENSPVPLWEEDFTQLYLYFEELRQQGVSDFREYFNQHPAQVKICAQKIIILRVNKAALKLHGAQNKEALLDGLDSTFTDNTYLVFKEELIAFASGKMAFEAESEAKTLAGELKHVFMSIKIEQNTGDTVKALFATLDITKRKRVEEELARHRNILACVADMSKSFLTNSSWESLMDRVLQLLGEASCVSRVYLFENHNDLGNQPLCSQSFEWCAKGVPEQIGNPDLQYINWYESGIGDWYEALGDDKVLMRQRSIYNQAEHAMFDSQGILSLLVVPLFVNNKFWGCIGFDDSVQERMWSDIEIGALMSAAGVIGGAIQREKSKHALRESEQRFRGLVESTNDWIWEMSLEGDYTYSSPSIEKLLGCSAEDIIGKSVFELMPDEAAEKSRLIFESIIEQKKSFSGLENIMLHKDGTQVILETNGVPIYNQRGVLTGYRGIDRDISDRKRAEQTRLVQAEKQRDELVREVHHRIKNHLQGLMGLLKQRANEGCEYHAIVDEAVTQIESIAIVYGLQASHLGAEIYFGQMVEAIVYSASGLTSLSLSMSQGKESGSCEVDRNKAVALALVVHELLVNAIKHFSSASDSSEIEINHLHAAEKIILTVRNPGQLPSGFDFKNGKCLGTGLELVKAMLPGRGANLDVLEINGEVMAKLTISSPLLING